MNKNDPLFQAFQVYPSTASSETIYISTQLDNITGQRVILWDDIQLHFKNAASLMSGGDVVPFLVDADGIHHLIPLMIAHHSGIVLEVLIASDCHDDDDDDDQSMSSATLAVGSDKLGSEDDMDAFGQSLVVYSQSHDNQYNTSYGHSDRLQLEINKNHSLQERLLQLEEQMKSQKNEIQRLQRRMKEKEVEVPQFQRQFMSQLAVVQNRVQMLLVQTYEMHEDPIPRLFIILPKSKAKSPQDKPTMNQDQQFQLYFLCECGTHTMVQGCKVPPEIHLAKHDGYDLDKPKEFFQKYGSYTLTMMYMIKYGIVATGIVVPPLANTKIMVGSGSAQKHLEGLDNDIGPLVDDTIIFLQNIKGDSQSGSPSSAHHPELDKLGVHEGADLKQLESYLLPKSESGVLGNLYRVVTHEGHVKWVCSEHYRTNYRESTMRQLQDIVEANGGTLIEATGKVEIKIVTSMLAKQFYEVMVNSRGIQELEITLQWDATMEDFQELFRAVTKANVICLTIDGTYLNGPWIDLVNWDCRFDSLIRLASSGRIQSLRLVHFEDFFARVESPSCLAMAPRLRVLSIDGEIPFKDSAANSFLCAILDNYPALAELNLHLEQRYRTRWPVTEIIRQLDRLETLTLDYEQFSTSVVVSKGVIQRAEMRIVRLCDLVPSDLEFACKGHLDQLVVEFTPQEPEEARLADMLRQNPRIKNATIGCLADRSFAIINLVISTRTKAVGTDNTFTECTFELTEEQLTPWNADRPFDGLDHISATVVFPASPSSSSPYTMRTRIIMHDSHGAQEFLASKVAQDIIMKYGWSVESLRAPSTFESRHVDLLALATINRKPQLRILDVDLSNLKEHELECLMSVIERSELLDTPKMRLWARKWGIRVERWHVE